MKKVVKKSPTAKKPKVKKWWIFSIGFAALAIGVFTANSYYSQQQSNTAVLAITTQRGSGVIGFTHTDLGCTDHTISGKRKIKLSWTATIGTPRLQVGVYKNGVGYTFYGDYGNGFASTTLYFGGTAKQSIVVAVGPYPLGGNYNNSLTQKYPFTYTTCYTPSTANFSITHS